jgi:hypothetical protein
MSIIKVECTAEDGALRVITFRRVLLSKVQQEFEKDKEDDEEREGLLRAIEATQDVSTKTGLTVVLNRCANTVFPRSDATLE